MIPNHYALVPVKKCQQAAMMAISHVETRRNAGKRLAEYPYAMAFFLFFMGSKRAGLKEIRCFSSALTEKELRGKKANWLSAIDCLIESRGQRCYLPLSSNDAEWLFPAVRFSEMERLHRRAESSVRKTERCWIKEKNQREQRYQATVGQAEIELAFFTPENVASWASRWRDSDIKPGDLEEMFFRWGERFPSLSEMDRWMYKGLSLGIILYDVKLAGKDTPESVKVLERWMVPNKLMFAGNHVV
ncbi:plasmid SOS inhibition protein A [Klebsiella oxytoca]|uniref:plasmid SOS inhibition protein A n=1 Tax=Klebsiella oxytoca TaxID=571 RepID=UPI0034D23607